MISRSLQWQSWTQIATESMRLYDGHCGTICHSHDCTQHASCSMQHAVCSIQHAVSYSCTLHRMRFSCSDGCAPATALLGEARRCHELGRCQVTGCEWSAISR